MIEDIVVIRLDFKVPVALLRVCIIVEVSCPEHIFFSVGAHWHGLISTCQNIPSTHIFISRRISINFVAGSLIERVVVADRLFDGSKQGFIVRVGCDFVERNAGRVGRPSCHIF